MHDLIYRFDPEGTKVSPAPADAAAAKARLLQGNQAFVNLFKEEQVVYVAPASIGIGSGDAPLVQRPFATILSCSDARVPVELIFRCGSNELFVVRVAGNVPGDECLGSLEYASASMAESIHLHVVLGPFGLWCRHGSRGQLSRPAQLSEEPPLRAVIDRILPAVRTADTALQREQGGGTRHDPNGRNALVAVSVILNVALSAMTVRDESEWDSRVRRLRSREPRGEGRGAARGRGRLRRAGGGVGGV